MADGATPSPLMPSSALFSPSPLAPPSTFQTGADSFGPQTNITGDPGGGKLVQTTPEKPANPAAQAAIQSIIGAGKDAQEAYHGGVREVNGIPVPSLSIPQFK